MAGKKSGVSNEFDWSRIPTSKEENEKYKKDAGTSSGSSASGQGQTYYYANKSKEEEFDWSRIPTNEQESKQYQRSMIRTAAEVQSDRQKLLRQQREAYLAAAEQRYKERAAAREAGAAAQQTAQTPGVPAFTNRYTAPAAAGATLGFQQQTQNRMSYQPRSITDRDSVVQGKVYEGAAAGMQQAEAEGDIYGYIQHLDAAQKAYGNLAQNQEDEWKKKDPVSYYASSMSQDALSRKVNDTSAEIDRLTKEREDAAREQARMEGRYGYDDYDEKKLEQLWRDQYIAGKRIEQLTADLAYYQGAIQLQDYQQYNQLREEYSPSGSMSPEEWKRRLAEGVKKYKAKKDAYNQAASLSNAGYASMAPSYQTDLMLGSAHDQERKQRQENIADAREQLAEDVENGWHLNKNDLDVFFVLYAEDPEKAEWFAHQAKLQRDDEYQKQIAQYSKGGPLRRFYGMQAGVVGRIMGGAVNLFAPYSETALELNRIGNALVGGAAEDVKERGLLNTGLLAGEVPEGHGILSGKSLADAYQLGSSMLESGIFAVAAGAAGNYGAAAAKVVEFLGTVIMGSSAAASDYDECVKRGLTRQQAMTHATAAGIAEAAFEYISLDKLVSQESKLGDSAGLKDHIKEAIGNFFVQGGIEASEEFCTSVANRISDYVLARRDGYDTKIEEREKELIRMGLKVQEAKKKAEQEWLTECINDAIGGFFSGGTMSGAKSTMEIADNWQQIRANDAARKARTAGGGDLISGGSRDVIGTDPSTAASGGPPPLQAGEIQTGETDSSASRDGGPVPYGAQDDSAETQGVREQVMQQFAEQARTLDDETLQAMAENVEQNLADTRDTAPPSEVAVMEGQRDALRQEISAREAVNRNGERMEAAARATEVPGVDWNDGRIAEAQNDTRADVGILRDSKEFGPYEENGGRQSAVPTNENGGQIARATETGGRIATASGLAMTNKEGSSYGTGTEGAAYRGQRDAGLGADRQAGGMGEGAGGPVARSTSTQERNELKNYVKALGDQRASARDVGIRNGTTNATNVLIDVEALTGSLRDRYTALREKAGKAGLRLDFVMGKMEIRMPGGKVSSNNGVFQIDADGTPHLFVQADSKMYSVEQIYEHEMFHAIVAGNKALWQDILQHLKETHTPEEIRVMVDAYVIAYDGCYNSKQNAEDLYLEELMADVYAEMQRGGGQQSTARELAGETAQRFAGDIENARQNRAGIDRTNGPGQRFSIKNMKRLSWEEQLKTHRHSDTLVVQNDVDPFLNGRVSNKPLAVPVSIVTKAQSGKDLGHSISPRNIRRLQRGIEKAVFVVDDPSRNSLVYITNLKDHGGLITAAFLKDQEFDGDEVHKASSIHSRPDPVSMLEALGEDAIVYVRKSELDKAPGSSMRIGTLKAQVKFIDDIVAEDGMVVKSENDGVDWIGSREAEQRFSAADEENVGSIDLSEYTGKDYAYMEAVKNGDEDQIRWMNDEAARQAGFSHKGFHQTGADFTSFNTDNEAAGQFDDETPTGIFIKPTDEDIGLTSGTKQMPLYFKADNMLEFADRAEIREYWKKNVPGYQELDAQLQARDNELKRQYDELDAEWFRVYEETYNSEDQSKLDDLDRQQDEFLEKWNKELQPIRRQMKNLVTEYMKGTNYDGIHLKYDGKVYGGPKVETYIVFDPQQTKSAELVTRDNQGKVIPISERFRTDRTGTEEWKNRDLRFSAADEEDVGGVDWLDGSELEEEGGQIARTEEKEERIATGPEGPRNDNARTENGGPMRASAPTETGEMAAEVSGHYEALAKDKKVEMAEKLGVDGLKSRIKSAEERLKMWRAMQSSGLVAKDANSVQELKNRIADTQETLNIFREELAKKQDAKKAAAADKELRAARKAERAAEKKALAKEAELKDNKPRQARREFRQDALNLFSVQAGKRQTLGNIINSFADKLIAQGSVSEADRAELFRQLYEAGVEVVQADEYHRNIRETVDSARIYVPDSVRAEFGDDWNDFRQKAWGNGVYLTNSQSDRGADSWNAELAEMFPGSFDAGETDARTMLENIVDLAEEGKAEFVSLPEMMQRNQAETGVTVDQQMDELERKVDHLIDTFAQKADLEIRTRKQGTMQLVKERQRNREMAARQVQRQRENNTRNEVMKQLQQLNRMRKKSAPEIQRQIDDIIGNLDTMARSISPEGMENLQALARKYEEAKAAAGGDWASGGNFLGNPYVEARLARLGQIQLDSLEISDVIELGNTISALVKSVTEDKRLLTDAREREISEAAAEVAKEISSSAGSKGGKLREFLGNEHLSPTRELQRLGGWVRGGMMEQLSRSLEDGGTRRMEYQRQATRIFDDFLSDKANQEWLRKAQGKDAEWITITAKVGVTGKDVLSGEAGPKVFKDVTFELTPMMRVGLLMHSKNKDNLRHIDTGGIVIPNKECYLKGNLADADAKGLRVKIQPEIVRAIVKDCTAQEKAFAALLEQYYDGFSKEKINEVSMLIDGFERAGGDHYYHIPVSRAFLATLPEQVKQNLSLEAIQSIVNERIHAGNPIVLEDASTALKDHIDLISKYYGYTAPIRDFNAVMNYTFHFTAETKGGGEYVANAFSGSVKETLQAKWGAGAQKYVDDLLGDLQQSSGINETAAAFLAKLRGNLAGASLMFNPAVAISQTASLPGAIQVVGFDGMVAGLKPEKVDMNLVEKYTPILWYRNQGNSTQELGDYMSRQGLEGKLPWFFNWIQKMDSWTIRRLWAAAEYRVSKDTDLAPGSKAQIDAGEDAYYQEVARVFQRAVYDTQPNYSEMQRPAILRSKSDLTKALTMYKTVPLQYYNMMYEAVGRLRADAARAKADPANKHYQAELSKSKSFAAKTFAGILGANVTYVVMKALVKGMLGGKKDKYLDEEGKLDAGKIFGNLGKDLIDTYAGSVIFGSEMVSLLEKYVFGGNAYNKNTFEISFLSSVNSVFAELQTLRNKLEKEDYRGGLGAVKDLAKKIAMVCGIPAQNVETYLRGITKLISPEWADRYDNLFDEIERGDLKGQTGRDLRAALRVLMDNRTDGLKDETVEELLRLWGNGQTVQVPSAIPSDFTIDNEKRVLTASERSRYRDLWNQTVSGSLEEMIASEAYQNADDKDKARMIKKLYDYAGQLAKEAVTEAEAEPWVKLGQACADVGLSLEDYLTVAAVNKDKLKDMDGMELDAAIEGIMRFRAGELKDENLDELGRLWATGATKAIPGDVPTEIKVNGEEQKLTPEERAAWMLAWKQTAGEGLDSVIGSKLYQDADDKGKEKIISDFYTMAKAMANAAVKPEYEASDRWLTAGIEAQKMGVPMDEYVLCHEQLSGASSAKNKIQILKQQGWDDRQKEKVWLEALASETQAKKYENLKNGGASWADAMTVMDIGGDATEGLTEAQTKVYNQRWEEITANTTKRLMQTQAYKKATAEEKEALVDKLNTYASAVAKAEATKTASKEAWVNAGISATKAGVKLEDYIVFTNQLSKIDGKDENGESMDGLARNRELALLNATGWTDKQKEIVFLESGMTDKESENKERALRNAGLTWMQTSDVMGTVGSTTDKAYAVINSGATDDVVYKALEVYLNGSTLRTAQVGINYRVDLKYWASARKEASTDGNNSVSQEEATAYIDNLNLGWEDKAYLWQMVCYSSKWMKNPYSTTLGKDIWYSLHPEE